MGNIRTALFNWLFARHTGGTFIVRIEDTDRERFVPGAEEAILEGLRWLGLDWDEGPNVGGPHAPYRQSERLPIYQSMAQRLVDEGKAYRCYCSPQRLEQLRKEQQARKEPPGYDRRCRNLSHQERAREEASGTPWVVRFKVPLEGETTFHDLVRGMVSWQNALLDDFVLLKSDGYPTYHLAALVDDHLMEITHVMRSEEWVPSTPRHLLLYQAFGWEPPRFAHLPMILGPDRAKLSKRHGATSILEYRKMGYLPDAMVNFLALLGWSLDDRTEIIPRDVLVRHFSIERVVKSPAIFNHEKLDWMNGVYIRQLSPEALAQELLAYWDRFPPAQLPYPVDRRYLMAIIPLIQERLKRLDEAANLVSFFFQERLEYNLGELVQKGMDEAGTLRALEVALDRLRPLEQFDAQSLEGVIRPLTEVLGLTTRQFFGALRVATTGRTAAPPLFETMAVLGKERCLRRLDDAIATLKRAPAVG